MAEGGETPDLTNSSAGPTQAPPQNTTGPPTDPCVRPRSRRASGAAGDQTQTKTAHTLKIEEVLKKFPNLSISPNDSEETKTLKRDQANLLCEAEKHKRAFDISEAEKLALSAQLSTLSMTVTRQAPQQDSAANIPLNPITAIPPPNFPPQQIPQPPPQNVNDPYGLNIGQGYIAAQQYNPYIPPGQPANSQAQQPPQQLQPVQPAISQAQQQFIPPPQVPQAQALAIQQQAQQQIPPHNHQNCPSLNMNVQPPALVFQQPPAQNFVLPAPNLNYANNRGNIAVNSQGISQSIVLGTPQQEMLNQRRENVDVVSSLIDSNQVMSNFLFNITQLPAIQAEFTQAHQNDLQNILRTNNEVLEQQKKINVQKLNLASSKIKADRFHSKLIMPPLADDSTRYSVETTKLLESKNVLLGVRPFDPEKEPSSDFAHTWRQVLEYTKAHFLTEQSYINILMCVLQGSAHTMLLDLTENEESLSSILKELSTMFCKQRNLLDRRAEVNKFARLPNESIFKTMSRASIAINRLKIEFETHEWANNKTRMLNCILDQVVSKATKAHIDAKEKECMLVGSTLCYDAKLTMVDTFEQSNNEVPDRTVKTLVNACTGTPIDSSCLYERVEPQKHSLSVNSAVDKNMKRALTARSKSRERTYNPSAIAQVIRSYDDPNNSSKVPDWDMEQNNNYPVGAQGQAGAFRPDRNRSRGRSPGRATTPYIPQPRGHPEKQPYGRDQSKDAIRRRSSSRNMNWRYPLQDQDQGVSSTSQYQQQGEIPQTSQAQGYKNFNNHGPQPYRRERSSSAKRQYDDKSRSKSRDEREAYYRQKSLERKQYLQRQNPNFAAAYHPQYFEPLTVPVACPGFPQTFANFPHQNSPILAGNVPATHQTQQLVPIPVAQAMTQNMPSQLLMPNPQASMYANQIPQAYYPQTLYPDMNQGHFDRQQANSERNYRQKGPKNSSQGYQGKRNDSTQGRTSGQTPNNGPNQPHFSYENGGKKISFKNGNIQFYYCENGCENTLHANNKECPKFKNHLN